MALIIAEEGQTLENCEEGLKMREVFKVAVEPNGMAYIGTTPIVLHCQERITCTIVFLVNSIWVHIMVKYKAIVPTYRHLKFSGHLYVYQMRT